MKVKVLFPVIAVAILMTSCMNNSNKEKKEESSPQNENAAASGDWQSQYDRIEASDLPDNVFDLIGKQWMLVTAGVGKTCYYHLYTRLSLYLRISATGRKFHA